MPAQPLATSDGESLRVISPGRRNRGAGPDFVDAVLDTQGGPVRGAVEVHRRASDWRRHGHGADPRYADVLLHVVGLDDASESRPPGGAPLPLLELGASQGAQLTLDALVEPDQTGPAGSLLPGAIPRRLAPFPCAAALRSGVDLAAPLAAAGLARFRAAAERLQRAQQAFLAPGETGDVKKSVHRREAGASGEGGDGGELSDGSADVAAATDQVLFTAMAGALGYSQNTAPLRALAKAVPLAALRAVALTAHAAEKPPPAKAEAVAAVLVAEALLLGAAGMLPSQRHLPSVRRRHPYVAALERSWSATGMAPALRAYQWASAPVRPENSPVRRIVALAHLALRWPDAGLLNAVLAILASLPASPVGSDSQQAGPEIGPTALALCEAAKTKGASVTATTTSVQAIPVAPAAQASGDPAQTSGSAVKATTPAAQASKVALAARRLAALVMTECPPGFWAQHWDAGVPVRQQERDAPALVGSARAADIVINVLLPAALAAARLSGDDLLSAHAMTAYLAHPSLAENWITRLVRERIGELAGDVAGNVAGSACQQQGLIAVYEATCRDLRCDDCVLGGRLERGRCEPRGTTDGLVT